MRAATLRTPLEVVTRVRTADDAGGGTYSDSLVVTLYSRKLSDRETERYAGHQLQGVGRVVFETRYYSGLTTAHEAIQNSVRYRITGIEDPDEGRKRRLHLICERRPAS